MNTPARVPAAGFPLSRAFLFVLVAAAALVSDLYSKQSVFGDLGYPGSSDWTKRWFDGWATFELSTTLNHGALWGMGQGWTGLFATLSIAAGGGIVYWLFFRGGAQSLWLTIALGMILGGTLGNLYDRLGLHGITDLRTGDKAYAVRDFLHFTFFHGKFEWAVFNLADVFLVTGAIMLVLQSLRAEPFPGATPATASPANSLPESAPPRSDLTATAG